MQVEGAAHIDANDIDPKSVAAIQRNTAYNGPLASQAVHPTQASCTLGQAIESCAHKAMPYWLLGLETPHPVKSGSTA